jgi:acyl-[acyl-carrier-protein]-phospholipid O-acyltransferase/long-chain-fatty-acid--[acyl-carrier-protein] ligase
VASKRGTIGHPLPGVSVKVVDIESSQPLAAGSSGMLMVKGPNVMRGYLQNPAKTAEVLHEGWYTTGDVAVIDEDGFVTITDRLSRFSKIGGEMVPHIRIEEKLHELADRTEQVFAVTAVPDEKKGERIIVIHTLPEAMLAPVLDKLSKSDLPALWKPKANQFVHVDSILRWVRERWTCAEYERSQLARLPKLRQRPKPEVMPWKSLVYWRLEW